MKALDAGWFTAVWPIFEDYLTWLIIEMKKHNIQQHLLYYLHSNIIIYLVVYNDLSQPHSK